MIWPNIPLNLFGPDSKITESGRTGDQSAETSGRTGGASLRNDHTESGAPPLKRQKKRNAGKYMPVFRFCILFSLKHFICSAFYYYDCRLFRRLAILAP